ncbi:hypothetical protein [Campylobacter fetus]|nr:hypothetical protein [Campylobacter fetus]
MQPFLVGLDYKAIKVIADICSFELDEQNFMMLREIENSLIQRNRKLING